MHFIPPSFYIPKSSMQDCFMGLYCFQWAASASHISQFACQYAFISWLPYNPDVLYLLFKVGIGQLLRNLYWNRWHGLHLAVALVDNLSQQRALWFYTAVTTIRTAVHCTQTLTFSSTSTSEPIKIKCKWNILSEKIFLFNLMGWSCMMLSFADNSGRLYLCLFEQNWIVRSTDALSKQTCVRGCMLMILYP